MKEADYRAWLTLTAMDARDKLGHHIAPDLGWALEEVQDPHIRGILADVRREATTTCDRLRRAVQGRLPVVGSIPDLPVSAADLARQFLASLGLSGAEGGDPE